MAWGFRRSLRIAGPLRLNFSKSGLGLSLGVKGLHIGSGPRGAYFRGGIPGTGIYYRRGLNGPKPVRTRKPSAKSRATPWMQAAEALLAGDPERCLALLAGVEPGKGPAVHIEVEDDVVVTLNPDACGIAVLRSEALDRLGKQGDALAAVAPFEHECTVARIVAAELRGDAP